MGEYLVYLVAQWLTEVSSFKAKTVWKVMSMRNGEGNPSILMTITV